jgi:excisionase family DNA binding protein
MDVHGIAPMSADQRLLTVREVARLTMLSRSTVMALIRRGEIPSLTILRARRIRASDLWTWVDKRAEAEVRRHEGAVPGSDPGTA